MITINSSEKLNVIVFGVGKYYQLNKQLIEDNFNILALADNDLQKQNTKLNGYEIISPDNIKNFDFTIILVTVADDRSLEIKKQLISMGISIDKIRFTGEGGISPYRINPMFFASDLCYDDKKKLFSENIERVIIEVNSKCNRKCWFCTNSLFGDDESNIDMSDEVFEKIISELEEVNYSESICLSYFNEPLISEKLIDRITVMKKRISNAYIYAFSNGDYITKELIDLLSEAGLDSLVVDIYMNNIEYDINEAINKASDISRRLNLDINFTKHVNSLQGRIMYRNMEITILSQDFSKTASNRAESLCGRDLPIPDVKFHTQPCIKNFISFHIDFRGDVWPCPNYHREYQAHRQYCVGNVLDETIYDIYNGEKLMCFRKKNFFERSSLPCKSCIWNFKTFKFNNFLSPFSDRPSSSYYIDV